jgi:hypothetical protein
MDRIFQFGKLFRELAGLVRISTELMHFSSVIHRVMLVAKMNLIRHHLFTYFFCPGEVHAFLSTQSVGIIQTRAVSREQELFRVQRFRT